MSAEFYIVDLRASFRDKPYVSFWRAKNAGYAYPLPWSGRYSRQTVDGEAAYYYARKEGLHPSPDRFPVRCEIVDAMGVPPAPGIVDRNVGPVVPNTDAIRRRLRRYRYVPAGIQR